MQKKSMGLIGLFLGVLFTLTACASRQPLITVAPAKGETVIAVKAGSFKFEPNNIKAYKGDVAAFRIENVSVIEHNFTIKDPQGRVLQSVPLPSKKTATVKVNLSEAGIYEFYCDKSLHTTFGMEGRIEVVQAP